MFFGFFGFIIFANAISARHLTVPLFVDGSTQYLAGFYTKIQMVDERMKQIKFSFSGSVSELIAVDSDCGRTPPECPRFCNDEKFTAIFCRPICVPEKFRSIGSVCVPPEFRIHSHNQIEGHWAHRYSMKRFPMEGKFYNERINMDPLYGLGDYILPNLTFASSLMYEKRLFNSHHAIVGLLPGPNSAMRQLLDAFNLTQKIASFSHSRRGIDTVLRFLIASRKPEEGERPEHPKYMNRFETLLLLGGTDRSRCVDWKWMDSLSATSWALRFPVVDFMGVEFRDVTIRLDLAERNLVLSRTAAARLKQHGLIDDRTRNGDVIEHNYTCTIDRPIRFLNSDGSAAFELNWRTLLRLHPLLARACLSQINSDTSDIYAYSPYGEVWRMGMVILNSHCLAYDYERNRIGVGLWRSTTNFPLLPMGPLTLEEILSQRPH